MKKISVAFKMVSVAAVAALFCLASCNGGNVMDEESLYGNSEWHDGKYSMFIHFGLYSVLGGVWDGEPVTQGYSEQIQSFAGIFSDWYAMTADEFDPVAFDADSIVDLARRAGMKSIVFTSKHHDGFCMFGTQTTDFNSVDATPCGRDFVKELSDACAKAGMRFGLYFSIIDWHCPYGHPISSHNADFVTPEHHEYNKAQVTELLTNYGPISELWFDMGSQTPQQSRELYELVHSLQPECMVSGRIGNDYYDFSVMGDNRYPDGALDAPWQSSASMFDETWSYRSWQHRGSVADKALEKLSRLAEVVSHGGNYLLNIGPAGDGSVVPFEKDVLLMIGKWLEENGDAIYAAEPSPFDTDFEWGVITQGADGRGSRLNLILTGQRPLSGEIRLHMPGYRLDSCNVEARMEGDYVVFVPEYPSPDTTSLSTLVPVIKADFDSYVYFSPANMALNRSTVLDASNAMKEHSYSCFDYYSNYRSTVSHFWDVLPEEDLGSIGVRHTSAENGKRLKLTISGWPSKAEVLVYEGEMILTGSYPLALEPEGYTVKGCYMRLFRGSSFDTPDTVAAVSDFSGWTEISESYRLSVRSHPFDNCLIVWNVFSPKEQDILLDVTAGNGMELFVNGFQTVKHLNPYRCKERTEKVLVRLSKGSNQIMLRSYNRFEDVLNAAMAVSSEQTLFVDTLTLPSDMPLMAGKDFRIYMRDGGSPSSHTDGQLHNISLRF